MADETTKKPITDEIATAARDIDLFSGWLSRLENPDPVLRTEASGKGLKLYDEVARDPHASAVLQTRYLSVTSREWEVLPAEEAQGRGRPKAKSRAQEIADFVYDVLLSTNFDQFRQELLQAILYGFYAAEILWTVRADGRVIPARILAKHPRRFSFTMDREPRLLTPSNMIDGEPLPDKKFIVFTYGSSDNPYGCGLGQKLWWPVWFKKNGIKFWLVFLDKFGQPTPIGKYPPGTDTTQQQALLDAIDAIQTDTGVKIPNTMEIGLLEASRGGNVTYEKLCDYMDRAISKAVLGQTLTTEVKGEGSYAASQTHDEVWQDIVKADADLLCECLNATLVKWLVDFNYAGVTEYPKVWIRTEPEEDMVALAGRDKTLVKDIGLPVTNQYFYETYGIPAPEAGDELVNPNPSTPLGPPMNGGKVAVTGGAAFAEGAPFTPDQQVLEDMAGSINMAELLAGNEGKLLAAVTGASSYEEAMERVIEVYPDLDMTGLEEMLGRAMLAADLHGRKTVEDGNA